MKIVQQEHLYYMYLSDNQSYTISRGHILFLLKNRDMLMLYLSHLFLPSIFIKMSVSQKPGHLGFPEKLAGTKGVGRKMTHDNNDQCRECTEVL